LRAAAGLWLALAAAPGAAAAGSEAEALLAAAIAHHDPQGVWRSGAWRVELEESRPDGPSRTTRIEIDNRRGRFSFESRRDGALLEGSLGPDGCALRLDGAADFPEALAEKHRHTCEQLGSRRNYYVYLYGLPMKLRDPGTRLDPEVEETRFQGRPVRALRVSYEPGVGGDTWYFYFDAGARLVGYRFFHDEAKGDGEYIVLEGESDGGGLRLPRSRTWYTNAEDRLLGTDAIVALTPLEPRTP